MKDLFETIGLFQMTNCIIDSYLVKYGKAPLDVVDLLYLTSLLIALLAITKVRTKFYLFQ